MVRNMMKNFGMVVLRGLGAGPVLNAMSSHNIDNDNGWNPTLLSTLVRSTRTVRVHNLCIGALHTHDVCNEFSHNKGVNPSFRDEIDKKLNRYKEKGDKHV